MIPAHIRRNHEATDTALIRLEGLAYALELVADDLTPDTPKSAKQWAAFYALAHQLGDQNEEVQRLREIEWVGQGGANEDFTEVEIAKARGEVK
jgi:hypothetical protein